MLLKKIENLENQLKNGRRHRFGRSSEQRRLLNNRDIDTRADEKDRFDGTGGCHASQSTDETPSQPRHSSPKPKRKRQPKQGHKCDLTVMHHLEDYYQLPQGATFIRRNGKRDTWYYRCVEVIKARYVEHIYEVARVRLPNGEFTSTMEKKHAELRGILSPTLLAQVLAWKYAYHLPASRIIKKLGDSGLHFSKATLNRYMQNGMRLLREYLEETMRREILDTDYIMADETTGLVGIDNMDGSKNYRKRYLWAFFAQMKKMVLYVYEKGSWARKVAQDFLKEFGGFLSTDGYVAYSIFDDTRKSGIVHVGCWTHARRKFVEALPGAPRAMKVINLIAELFQLESTFKVLKLSPEEIRKRRKKRSQPILNKIHDMAVMMSADMQLMANKLMESAVKYLLNQWKTLENYIRDGRVQISNNLCEQRMRTVKINLKNCQNIGSERAAENAAFIFSLTESCTLNGISPENYLERIFNCITSKKEYDKRMLLPCHIKI